MGFYFLFKLSSKHFHSHGQITYGVMSPTRVHTKCCSLDELSTDLQKALTAGGADLGVSFPPASSAVAPKETFLLMQHLWWNICQGFDLGLLVCAYSVQDSQRVSQPNLSYFGVAEPTTSHVLLAECKTSKSYNADVS